MICNCFGRTFELSASMWAGRARAAAELVVGLADYDVYAAHFAANHPDLEIMTRDAFFRARQSARFGAGGGLRCC